MISLLYVQVKSIFIVPKGNYIKKIVVFFIAIKLIAWSFVIIIANLFFATTNFHLKMDGNKDEAQRCINIALEAAKSGNLQRAEKFLRKADNLYPSQKAKGNFIY